MYSKYVYIHRILECIENTSTGQKEANKKAIEMASRYPKHLNAIWHRVYARDGIVRVDNVVEQNEIMSSYENLKYYCLKGIIIYKLYLIDMAK